MVHTDGWRPEISLEAMKRARKSGVPVSYDAGHGSNHVETLIKNSDTVIASESLVRELLGRRSPKSAVQRLGEMGPSTAVITYGERGSIAARDGQTLSIGVYRVDAQDTTGAGDAFRGGYIAAQLRGCDFETSLRAASATAAMCCRELSSRGGLPRSWGTLRAFMRRAVYEEPKS
jgi:sugar/nucleoside kinase (ribokinase family)